MAIRAGSMSVRTTNVSRSTDETSTRPSWLMDTVLVRKRPEKAKVMMSPAAEMTPADVTRPSRIASRSERPLRRSSCGRIQDGKTAKSVGNVYSHLCGGYTARTCMRESRKMS